MCINSIHCHSGLNTWSLGQPNTLWNMKINCESEDKPTKFLRYMYMYIYTYIIQDFIFGGDVVQATKAWGFKSMLPRENFTDLEARNTL